LTEDEALSAGLPGGARSIQTNIIRCYSLARVTARVLGATDENKERLLDE
jgi:hypothetical protein